MPVTLTTGRRVVSGIRTCLPYDNLRLSLRDVYYALMADGIRATHMLAGREALCGYEHLTQTSDPPVTMYKDLVVSYDQFLPVDVIQFMRGSEVVGQVTDIS